MFGGPLDLDKRMSIRVFGRVLLGLNIKTAAIYILTGLEIKPGSLKGGISTATRLVLFSQAPSLPTKLPFSPTKLLFLKPSFSSFSEQISGGTDV